MMRASRVAAFVAAAASVVAAACSLVTRLSPPSDALCTPEIVADVGDAGAHERRRRSGHEQRVFLGHDLELRLRGRARRVRWIEGERRDDARWRATPRDREWQPSERSARHVRLRDRAGHHERRRSLRSRARWWTVGDRDGRERARHWPLRSRRLSSRDLVARERHERRCTNPIERRRWRNDGGRRRRRISPRHHRDGRAHLLGDDQQHRERDRHHQHHHARVAVRRRHRVRPEGPRPYRAHLRDERDAMCVGEESD